MKEKNTTKMIFSFACVAMVLAMLFFFGCLYRFMQANGRAPQIFALYLRFQSFPLFISIIGIIYINIRFKEKDLEIKTLLINLIVFVVFCIVSATILLIWQSII